MEKLQLKQLKSNLTSRVLSVDTPGTSPLLVSWLVLVLYWSCWCISCPESHPIAEKSNLLGFRLEIQPCQFPSHYILPAGIVKRTKEIFSCSTFLHFLLVFIFLSIFVISSKYFPSLRPQLSLSTKKEPREQRKMLIEETILQNRKYINQQENIT